MGALESLLLTADASHGRFWLSMWYVHVVTER
jgi:hypothetical protein